MSLEYRIKLDDYEGPLEQLLRLVEKQEIEAASVQVFLVVRQLVECLAAASYSDIDEGSRYLVLAATLLALKAQNLLPAREEDSEPENGQGETTGLEGSFTLVARDEYLQIREATNALEECARNWFCSYRRQQLRGHEEAAQPDLTDDIARLVAAFKEIVEQNNFPAYRVEISVNFQGVMESIFGRVKGRPGGLLFRMLFSGVDRLQAIYNFLAVLELVYLGRIRIRQLHEAGEIVLTDVKKRSVSSGDHAGNIS